MSFKNKLNRYVCRGCNLAVVTIDRDDGVTPFLIGCRATEGCDGLMQSSMYRGVYDIPTFEWRKPTPKEFAKASHGMKDHFNMGGLDIHRIESVKP